MPSLAVVGFGNDPFGDSGGPSVSEAAVTVSERAGPPEVTAESYGPLVLAEAPVHSYVVAFWVSAGILAGSAVVCALVLPSGTLTHSAGPAGPAAA